MRQTLIGVAFAGAVGFVRGAMAASGAAWPWLVPYLRTLSAQVAAVAVLVGIAWGFFTLKMRFMIVYAWIELVVGVAAASQTLDSLESPSAF
jgi:hypothetical protein